MPARSGPRWPAQKFNRGGFYEEKSTTAEILAKQHGVLWATIEGDEQFSEAVETLKPGRQKGLNAVKTRDKSVGGWVIVGVRCA